MAKGIYGIGYRRYIFTASGTPSPQTTINQVTYTSSHTRGVEAGVSVAAGVKGDMPYAEKNTT